MTRETRLLRVLLVMFLVGLVPVIVAVKVVFDFLSVVDQGEAFSIRTIRLLRRLKVLIGITAAYLTLGLAGVWVAVWVAMGQTKGSMVLVWFAAEVVTLFLYTLVALLERLFSAALELRQDHELTV